MPKRAQAWRGADTSRPAWGEKNEARSIAGQYRAFAAAKQRKAVRDPRKGPLWGLGKALAIV
jgi:hypothetical protein